MKGLGMSIAIFPFSWHFGPWNRGHKWLFAIGPFRLVFHNVQNMKYGALSS